MMLGPNSHRSIRIPPHPVARLAAALRHSEAQVLAIDHGDVESEADPYRAERNLDDAVRERRALEDRPLGWLPGRRGQLERARERELAATAELAAARRRSVELGHAARPFVTNRDLDERESRRAQHVAERHTQRLLDRVRDLGRGL